MTRRIVDIVAAVVLLTLCAIPLAAISLAIRVALGGPVLFRQQRCGLHGRRFTILKFRTMRPAAYDGELDRDRLSGLGRLLRRTSLDELPQLFNILRGDMSFIGPRPTLPGQVARYDERQRARLSVRPGVTGWAQVNGRNALSWPERIELDLWYVEHRSMAVDLRILGRTFVQVLRPVGITGEGGINPDFP